MMNETNLYDISAEFLLNHLYPNQMDRWQVNCVGTFYRNYSEDILEIDEEKANILLARDSFLRLLPQGLISDDNALKGNNFEQKYERLKKKEELLRLLFKPVDTLAFRFRLHIENQVTQLSEKKLAFLLKYYFLYDITREKDPYIKRVAPFLLFISQLRANFGFIRDLLACLFNHKVEIHRGLYIWEEDEHCASPAIEFQLIVPNLTAKTYDKLDKAIAPLREFLIEWFIPFDTHCVIDIKQHGHPFTIGESLTLDYNTEIGQ